MKTINEIINELRDDKLKENPNQLSQYLVILSASMNEAGNFELDAEMDYAKVWEELKLSQEKITDKNGRYESSSNRRIQTMATVQNRQQDNPRSHQKYKKTPC